LALNDFWLFPKNNVCLNGTKISGYWGIKRCDVMESYSTTGVPKNVSNSGSIVGLSA